MLEEENRVLVRVNRHSIGFDLSRKGYPPMPFDELPDEFTCPDCGVRYKEDLEPVPDER